MPSADSPETSSAEQTHLALPYAMPSVPEGAQEQWERGAKYCYDNAEIERRQGQYITLLYDMNTGRATIRRTYREPRGTR